MKRQQCISPRVPSFYPDAYPPPPTLPSKPLTPPKDMKTKTTRFVIYYMYHVFFKNVSFMAKINLGETITIVSIL